MRRTLAILFTAAPFVAGTIAAVSVRHDLRMLWMAVTATLVARLIIAATPARWGGAAAFGVAFVAAAVAASVVAVLFGARAAFGIVAVAVVLAGCAAVGAALGRRSPPAAV